MLLPGMDGTGVFFRDFIRQLPAGVKAQVVAYPENAQLSYEQLAEHVRKMIPADQPYIIIAESYSGPVAALLTLGADHNLRAVVFVASFICRPWGRIGRWVAGMLPEFMLHLRPPSWMLRFLLMNASTSAAFVDEVQRTIAGIHPKVLVARIRDALRADFSQAFANSKVRVACILPQNDRLLGDGTLRAFVAARPDIEILHVAGPHFLLQCSAEQCAAVLRGHGFLSVEQAGG